MAKRRQQRPTWTGKQIAAFAALGVVAVGGLTIGAISEHNTPTSAEASVEPATASTTPAAAAAIASPTPATSQPSEAAVLTKATSPAFAKLITSDEDFDLFDRFAADHEGDTIRFNGVIAALDPYGSYKTRYNLLVLAGNSAGAGAKGPNFHFTNVGIADLNLTGDAIPDNLEVGQKIRITATVQTFDDDPGLLELEPVTTEFR